MRVVGLADRAGCLDRMHEAQHRLRKRRADETHLGNRGDVVMRHAIVPQDLQQIGRRIGLHRIERLARKLLDEETGGARGGMRTIENYGFVGREGANYGPGVRKCVQLKGPPKRLGFRQGCLAVRVPLGQRRRAHRGYAQERKHNRRAWHCLHVSYQAARPAGVPRDCRALSSAGRGKFRSRIP